MKFYPITKHTSEWMIINLKINIVCGQVDNGADKLLNIYRYFVGKNAQYQQLMSLNLSTVTASKSLFYLPLCTNFGFAVHN